MEARPRSPTVIIPSRKAWRQSMRIYKKTFSITLALPLRVVFVRSARYIPCFCITLRNFTTTLDDGRMRTWRFPRRSAFTMLTRASFYSCGLVLLPAFLYTTYQYRDPDHVGLEGYEKKISAYAKRVNSPRGQMGIFAILVDSLCRAAAPPPQSNR